MLFYLFVGREVFFVAANGERSGRVIRYDKKTKEAKVVMDNLLVITVWL